MRGWVWVGVLCGALACGDDSSSGGDDGGGVDAPGVDSGGGRRDSGGGGGDDAGGGGGELDCRDFDSWPADWAAEEVAALEQMNREREAGSSCPSGPKASVPPLEMNRELRISARCHSMDMATNDFFSHTGSGDTSFGERARTAGYDARPRFENIAAGNGTGIASGWAVKPVTAMRL